MNTGNSTLADSAGLKEPMRESDIDGEIEALAMGTALWEGGTVVDSGW
jgi:hypothetical protein